MAEFYGQTECNLIVSNAPLIFDVKNGSIGRPVPGHNVKVIKIDENDTGDGKQRGILANRNETGVICVKEYFTNPKTKEKVRDPVMFKEYWNLPEKTLKKYVWVKENESNDEEEESRWLITGDMGMIDNDGYFWFVGRDDDIINTSGYRCGPTEIESACMKHPKVINAAAIGKPDELRNSIVKVFALLNESYDYKSMDANELDKIRKELQELVKNLVGKHEYPREIEFVDSLPMTTTGKIQRHVLRAKEIAKMK